MGCSEHTLYGLHKNQLCWWSSLFLAVRYVAISIYWKNLNFVMVFKTFEVELAQVITKISKFSFMDWYNCLFTTFRAKYVSGTIIFSFWNFHPSYIPLWLSWVVFLSVYLANWGSDATILIPPFSSFSPFSPVLIYLLSKLKEG